MESSAAAHQRSRSDSAVKLVGSLKDLLTGVLGVISVPLTVGVIVVVSLVAFNDYERWSHRDLRPSRAHELELTKVRAAGALELVLVNACRSRSTPLWTCVGKTKSSLAK
jgi:hypothetical protein